ncbi:MAG: sulfatase-like hydrolase/transferase [Planctomycetota bacterium]|nr:sulfatase-like hydrolase/transferase [Planctomycetota bacterium]
MRLLLTLATIVLASSTVFAEKPPNVVVIMTDNHGAWTLGCYGNRDIDTPNIDRLAAGGMKFTQAFANNAVCSPTRATFLTGLMPCQHGVHSFLRRTPLQMGPEARSTVAEFDTLPQVLSEAGYECGLVGKWHLGANMTPQEGFSKWITTPHGGTQEFYDAEIIENGKLTRHPGYTTDLWTENAVRFVEDNSKGQKPFFLFLSYNGPYGLGPLLLNESKNRHVEKYSGRLFESFPRERAHPWLFNNRDYLNNLISIRRFAAELNAVDDGVGEVMAALRKSGAADNTLVVFTADQGWVGGHGGFWGMGDHTRPLTAYDGMLKIPLIFNRPGSIPAGSESDQLVSNYDLMPTLLSSIGLKEKMPAKPLSPGRDFSRTLTGEYVPWKDEVFYEFENTRAIRTPDWKLIKRFPYGPDELFELGSDPDERTNLTNVPVHGPIKLALQKRLDDFFKRHADPRFDLWNGGGSKTKLLVMDAPVLGVPASE